MFVLFLFAFFGQIDVGPFFCWGRNYTLFFVVFGDSVGDAKESFLWNRIEGNISFRIIRLYLSAKRKGNNLLSERWDMKDGHYLDSPIASVDQVPIYLF